MRPCTPEEFKTQLERLQNDPKSGLSGPFIHSAPAGNMFQGPFRMWAWQIGSETILKKTWSPETGEKYYTKLE